jgi:DNA topoisomerase II
MSAFRGISRRGPLGPSQLWRHPIPLATAISRTFGGPGFTSERFPVVGWCFRRKYPFSFSGRGFASSIIEYEVDSEVENETPEGKTVEEQYSRMTPLEHVLLRPGMYVGSTQRAPHAPCWVLASLPVPPTEEVRNLDPSRLFVNPPSELEDESDMDPEELEVLEPRISPLRIVEKEYGIAPALIKVFDEILVNASDNRLRHPKTCKRIDIVIDPGDDDREPFIRVLNDGKGIPVHMHETEQMYVPELVFGHLLTGSNFDDSEKRVTGGRHGYGAKLTNIFSKTFTVETLDSKQRLKYRQTWSNNMTVADAPIISGIPKDAGKLSDYTCVEFVPDLPRLTGDPNCSVIPREDYAVMCRRAIDAAGCAAGKLLVTLNGEDVSLSSFSDYCLLYRSSTAPPLFFKKLNARWHVCVGLSESGSLEAISFVNGMATTRGGTHVNALVNQITKHIHAVVTKLKPDLAESITPPLIRRNLFLCVDAQIENASFDSQMKEFLTSSPETFGSSCTLPPTFLKSLVQDEEKGGPGIVEHLIRAAEGSQKAKLLRSGKKKTRRQLLCIPKLEDAHKAGSDGDQGCTLILTEGDSAKSLAIAGLEVIGRDYFGVFPLRGKLLNVRAIPIAKLAKNEEIKALLAIIGLSFDREYDTLHERRKLRYRRVMIMTDQDTGKFIVFVLESSNHSEYLTRYRV